VNSDLHERWYFTGVVGKSFSPEESPSIALWSRRTAARYKVVHDFVSRHVTKFEAVLLQIMQTSAIEGGTINKIKNTPSVDQGRRHLEFHF
jgi:hypothetical protein